MILNLKEGNEEKNLNLTIYSGILGVSQDPEIFLIKPRLGFLIFEEKKNSGENSTNFNTDL